MRRVIRWLLRNLVLIWKEDWDREVYEMRARQAIVRTQAYCDAELRSFRIGLSTLERLQLEAARAQDRFPEAHDHIEEMLRERMQHLTCTLNQQASYKRPAA